MIALIDRVLDRVTMYRLVLYYLDRPSRAPRLSSASSANSLTIRWR